MPEKKRGFKGLEQRIQEMEAEDRKREREASEEKSPEAPRTDPTEGDAGKPQR